jgi:hypothetical protein
MKVLLGAGLQVNAHEELEACQIAASAAGGEYSESSASSAARTCDAQAAISSRDRVPPTRSAKAATTCSTEISRRILLPYLQARLRQDSGAGSRLDARPRHLSDHRINHTELAALTHTVGCCLTDLGLTRACDMSTAGRELQGERPATLQPTASGPNPC